MSAVSTHTSSSSLIFDHHSGAFTHAELDAIEEYCDSLLLAQAVNRNYRFDLTGFHEAIQFMVYRDRDGGHFGWHLDVGPPVPRKLSLTLQLTDPARYEGGDLQFFTGDMVRTAPRERGMAIGFPSYMVHQVTPVTSGIRKSIVAWVTGPQLR